MGEFIQEELDQRIEKGWLFFDLRYSPVTKSSVSVHKEGIFFEPGKGWLKKKPSCKNIIDFVPGRKNKLRCRILIDIEDEKEDRYGNIYFFESHLEDIEIWELVGICCIKPNSFLDEDSVLNSGWFLLGPSGYEKISVNTFIEYFINKDTLRHTTSFMDVTITEDGAFRRLTATTIKLLLYSIYKQEPMIESLPKGFQGMDEINAKLSYLDLDRNSFHFIRLLRGIDRVNNPNSLAFKIDETLIELNLSRAVRDSLVTLRNVHAASRNNIDNKNLAKKLCDHEEYLSKIKKHSNLTLEAVIILIDTMEKINNKQKLDLCNSINNTNSKLSISNAAIVSCKAYNFATHY